MQEKSVILNLVVSYIKKYGLISAIFLLAPYYVLTPLFKFQTWHSAHDSTGTIVAAWSIVKTLREDLHFPVVWFPDDFVFNGSPFWGFYQPLSYLIVYIMSLITSNFDKNYIFSALKAAVYLSFLISELGMFLLIRTILKQSSIKNIIGVFGGLLYLLSPYRFIDLYSRSAYSELWVFAWIPFYFLGFYQLLFHKEPKASILISLSVIFLFASHFMPSLFFVIFMNLGFLIFLILKRNLFAFINENPKLILYWAVSHFIGFLFSCFYLIPAMLNIKYVVGDITGFERINLAHVLEHVSWCFGMLDLTNFNGPWQVGQIFLLGVIAFNFYLLSNKNQKFRELLVFLNILIMINFLFLMSKTLWGILPNPLYALQFSWLLFLVYSFIASLIISLFVYEIKLKVHFLIILLAMHFYTGYRFLYYGQGDVVAQYFNVESWINDIYKKSFVTSIGGIAYSLLPKTHSPTLFNYVNQTQLGNNEKYSNTSLLDLKPGVNINYFNRKGNTYKYEFLSERPFFIIFKQYFYPSWKLYIDSKESKNIYLTNYGFIGFEVAQGRHSVTIKTN